MQFWSYQMWISQKSPNLHYLTIFLSNFWQNHIWQLAKTGQYEGLAKTCLGRRRHQTLTDEVLIVHLIKALAPSTPRLP